MKKASFIVVILVSLFTWTCKLDSDLTEANQSAIEEARIELLDSLDNRIEKLQYDMEVVQQDDNLVVTLRNKEVRNKINLVAQDTSIWLSAHFSRSLPDGPSTIHLSQLFVKDRSIFLEAINLNDRGIHRLAFPIDDPWLLPPDALLVGSSEECDNIALNSPEYFEILALANQTCEPQNFYAQCCELAAGGLYCPDIYILPTNFNCIVTDFVLAAQIPPLAFRIPSTTE